MKTNRFLIALVCGVCLTALSGNVSAHPGHEHVDDANAPALRRWIDTQSGQEWRAAYITSKDGQVQLRQHDGEIVKLPIERLSTLDRAWIDRRVEQVRDMNTKPRPVVALLNPADESADLDNCAVNNAVDANPVAAFEAAFEPFAKLKAIKYRADRKYFYVESNGMPDHPMMIGITAWQQQVPLPQKYVGDNAWQIPLNPVPAKDPASAKGRFLRGAIALAVNGIPIFNPLNNRGDDAYLFGELDDYGGHCGRADDYHYHIAPVHLEKQVGKGKVIAYALDGFPIYGYDEPDGSKVVGLDWLNGHKDADGNYHYHATPKYPYLNGGFYGEVTEIEGQVDPQPRAQPVREFLPPLQGAKIVGFDTVKQDSYKLTYDVNGRKGYVAYTINNDGSVAFKFTDTSGKSTTETVTPRRRPPGGGKQDAKGPPRKGDKDKGKGPPRKEDGKGPPPRKNDNAGSPPPRKSNLPELMVSSSAIKPGENFPKEFTCDGAGSSPPVEWSEGPQGTKAYAMSLWHTAPDQEKSYWVVYNIPANTTKLAKNSKSVGMTGVNDMRRNAYEPMCSKGPGVKQYHITVFALSAEVKLSPNQANRASLLEAIQEITLAEGALTFEYERNR
jgi:phosphatidylethanolamine-binding protein (PEBP) family uncharacterized protein